MGIFDSDYRAKGKSATELLVDVMSEFSKDEPKHIMIIWTSETDCIQSVCNSSVSHGLGMIEVAKDMGICISRGQTFYE